MKFFGKLMSNNRLLGTFGAGHQPNMFGEITFAGENTELNVYGEDLEHISSSKTIYGVTQKMEKVTCLRCVSRGVHRTMSLTQLGQRVKFFPHFVVSGPEYISEDNPVVDAVTFSFTDIDSIFSDRAAINTILPKIGEFDAIFKENGGDDVKSLGDLSIISYFNGDREIFRVATSLGVVVARNVPSISSRRAFSNEVLVGLEFDAPIHFFEATNRVLTLRNFFSVICGRPQEVSKLNVHVYSETRGPEWARKWLKVYWSISPIAPANADPRDLEDYDMPLQAARDKKSLATVLINWLTKADDLQVPRYRYIECIESDRSYSVSRLVSAANMFDLLPPEMVPPPRKLTGDLAEAAAEAKRIFKELEDSRERNSMLTAIGLLGKPSLPSKAAHRASIVKLRIGHRLPNLDEVIKVAIQTRNHFVHGTPFNYSLVNEFLSLMTDSLEFIFAVSELIECGWDINEWDRKPKTMSHSFSRFVFQYKEEIEDFMVASSKLKVSQSSK